MRVNSIMYVAVTTFCGDAAYITWTGLVRLYQVWDLIKLLIDCLAAVVTCINYLYMCIVLYVENETSAGKVLKRIILYVDSWLKRIETLVSTNKILTNHFDYNTAYVLFCVLIEHVILIFNISMPCPMPCLVVTVPIGWGVSPNKLE